MEEIKPIPNPKENRQERHIKVEHLKDLDVIINLDCSDMKGQEEVLKVLREKAPSIEHLFELYVEIACLHDEDGKHKFFSKMKRNSQAYVDFVLKRTEEDPISPFIRFDFDSKSRYAKSGVLNEIILSKKIKALIASEPAQALARQYGFAGFRFMEPLLAVVSRTQKENPEKMLVYQNIGQWKEAADDHRILIALRELFKKNGIYPHDLRYGQLLVDKDNNLVLIDVEAYTEEK